MKSKGKKISKVPILNDTVLSVLEDYKDIILKPYVKKIYDDFVACGRVDIALIFLKQLPQIACGEFKDTVNECLGSTSDAARSLIYINKMLKSKDISLLTTNSEIYKDILEGKIYKKLDNDSEKSQIVHMIQKVLVEYYDEAVNLVLHTDEDIGVLGEHQIIE